MCSPPCCGLLSALVCLSLLDFFSRFINFMCVSFICMYHECAWCLQRSKESILSSGNWSYGWLYATMWVQVIESSSSSRANALKHWTISLDLFFVYASTISYVYNILWPYSSHYSLKSSHPATTKSLSPYITPSSFQALFGVCPTTFK